MKRAIIVHCWEGRPEYAWYPWLKQQLESRGYEVAVPAMPDTAAPRLDKWLPYLQHVTGEPDDEPVLIGHSLGCVAIMRYLESLTNEQTVGKVVLVAGFTDQLGFRELENFFEKPLDYGAIKTKSAHGFVVIQSDNDPYVSKQYGTRLREELGAELVTKHAAGHMSEDDNCRELPEVVAAVTS